MSHALRVVCGPGVARGFAIAGLAVTEVPTAEAGAAEVERLEADPQIGVFLVEDAVWAALSEPTRRALGRRPLPMVVPFPGPAEAWAEHAEEAEAYLVEILRKAVGYRVRLR